jgi:hypothetical protein
LYAVHGNLCEWCGDIRPDGRAAHRGGSFGLTAKEARAGYTSDQPTNMGSGLIAQHVALIPRASSGP